MTYLELNTSPTYMDQYTGALFLPHTDMGRFPTVAGAIRKARGGRPDDRRNQQTESAVASLCLGGLAVAGEGIQHSHVAASIRPKSSRHAPSFDVTIEGTDELVRPADQIVALHYLLSKASKERRAN
jgi:hypothetical protein